MNKVVACAATNEDKVPVIDLLHDDDDALVGQISRACSSYGFFQVVGHGVEGIPHFAHACRTYFTASTKKCRRHGTNARGYFDDELTKQKRDWKRCLDVGVPGSRDWTLPDDHPSNACLDGFNQFGEDNSDTTEFRGIVVAYFEACARLSHRLAVLMAAGILGCGLQEAESSSIVQDLQKQHTSYLRMNYYPTYDETKVSDQPHDGQLGVSPHRDAGFLTVLLQDDDCHSLQVQLSRDNDNDENGWHTVHPIPGALTINTGDMAQIWSNNRYRAPLHRVLTHQQMTRFSAPFFYNPGYDTLIQPELLVVTPVNVTREDGQQRLHYHPCLWGYFRAVRFAGDLTDLGVEIQVDDYRIETSCSHSGVTTGNQETGHSTKHISKQKFFAQEARFNEPFSVERFRPLLVD